MLVTMKMSDVIEAHNSLVALDGYSRIVKRNGEDAVIQEFYKLGGDLRWTIAGNIAMLKAKADQFETARAALTKATVNDDGTLSAGKTMTLSAEIQDLLDRKVEVDIEMIDRASLKLDDNPIPATVLKGIRSIVQC